MKIDDSRNIEVRINDFDLFKLGVVGVCKTLRDAGIPVRVDDCDELRLLDEWSVIDPNNFNPETDYVIGRGVLTVTDDLCARKRVFDYRPPVAKARVQPARRYTAVWEDAGDPNVIDVEAREIKDTPLLSHDN